MRISDTNSENDSEDSATEVADDTWTDRRYRGDLIEDCAAAMQPNEIFRRTMEDFAEIFGRKQQ